LTQNFFVHSTDYKTSVLEEIYYLGKHLNFTYSDIMIMPVYERKFLVNMLVEEFEKKKQDYENEKAKR
jgi:hypothetical protein